MFVLFNEKGELKINVVFFKRLKSGYKMGNLYDVLGNCLVRGTFLDFERKRPRNVEIIEIE